jgi:hypothetical protein
MAGSTGKKLKGCLVGCGSLVLLGLLLLLIQYLGIRWAAGRAIESRTALAERFDSQSTFTPAADGTIHPERLNRFLSVREAMFPFCDSLTAIQEPFARMEQLTAEDGGELPLRQMIPQGLSAIRGTFKLGRLLAKFETSRNESLLENEMGLGEYTWIYVITYYSWLGNRPAKFAIARESYPKIYQDRIAGNLRDMLQRHVDRNIAGLEQQAWKRELEALLNDAERIPFQDGLPPSLSTSLEPFKNGLESLFCSSATELEVMRTELDGIGFEHR